ncbi:Protein-S-isoprenylcysteine O-methyltransferase [Frankliniella fusca]|uniref:Protein-S-isoprenylcysteine O-methyltransferase n=1 Tax=Frankliniella fusca TaxID=407009 RepID=A0AAE1LRR2_9NEOP|nr:Protein-S-isoprenylcysteine O-methyltransferase [Frankliniella fusca]
MDKIKELNAYIAEEAEDKGTILLHYITDYCFHGDKHNVAVPDIFSKFMLIDESINVGLFEKWLSPFWWKGRVLVLA